MASTSISYIPNIKSKNINQTWTSNNFVPLNKSVSYNRTSEFDKIKNQIFSNTKQFAHIIDNSMINRNIPYNTDKHLSNMHNKNLSVNHNRIYTSNNKFFTASTPYYGNIVQPIIQKQVNNENINTSSDTNKTPPTISNKASQVINTSENTFSGSKDTYNNRNKSNINNSLKNVITQLDYDNIDNKKSSISTSNENKNDQHNIRQNLAEQGVDDNILQWLKITKPLTDIRKHYAILPTKPKNKTSLVLDLDETLVHCVTNDKEQQEEIDSTLVLTNTKGEKVNANLRIRPYAKEFIRWAAEYFEIIIFTASMEYQASEVVKALDPDSKYISQLLCREHCIRTENNLYIKDLRVIRDRSLDDILIVDNAIYSFAQNLPNGIPIKTWKHGKSDDCILSLYKQLKRLLALTLGKNLALANKITWKLNLILDVNEWRFKDDGQYQQREGGLVENLTRDYEKLKQYIKQAKV